jgi:hypothetical protein
MRTLAVLFTCLAVALLTSSPCRGEEKPKNTGKETEEPDKTEKEKEKETPVKPAEAKSDPKAEEVFRKAVEWQGRPKVGEKTVRIRDLYIEELLFKSFGHNEFEGKFRVSYTLPDKILFKIHTPSWWRSYRSDGKTFSVKTGASRGWGVLNPKDKDDSERILLVTEALRVVRLLFLENFLDGRTVFKYLGKQTYKKKDVESDPAHLVKCIRKDEDSILFYLGLRGSMPRCLVVHRFLNLEHKDRDFFLHLEKYRRVNGVRLPTRIRIYVRELSTGRDRRFLFCDLNTKRESMVRLNCGIPPRMYRD